MKFKVRAKMLPLLLLLAIWSTQSAWAQARKKSKTEQKVSDTIADVKKEISAPKMGATVEGITEYTLANGMKVLLFPDQTQQTITVNITYLVGSRHEGYGETGMAHLLEHMVFKGSTKHTNIPKELSDHGARPNGTTWDDRTNYFETFNATEENLKWALDLESDRMVNSFIKKEDLESEYTVVRNEFEMNENDPGNVLMERIISAGFIWHNYGNSTIGSREDLERVPIDKLQAFYKKYYQPDNSVLVVAGKFDPAKTLTLVNQYFGTIPKPARSLADTYTKEPAQDTQGEVTLKRVGDVQYLGALYHVPPGVHSDFATIDVLVDILRSEPSGPIYKALIDRKLAANQYGFVFARKEPGYAYFGLVVPTDKDLKTAKEVFLATLDSAQTRTYTAEEVNRAKTQTAKHLEQLNRNSENFAKMLSEFIALGDWRTFFLFRDAVEKVTPENVTAIAQKYFKPSNRTVGQFIPTTEPDRVHVPEAPNVAELVKDYKGRKTIAQGEAFEASPENIDQRNHTGKLGNGMEYALLAKTTRGQVVAGNMALRIGTKESLSNIGMIDNLTASMLIRGTKKQDRQAIKDKLDSLKSSLHITGGGSNISISINSDKEHLPEVLKVLEDVLKNPVFDEKELSNLKEEIRAGLESQKSDPMALASLQYSKAMSPYPKGDPRYVPNTEEQLEYLSQVTVQDMKDFHAKMYGASHATISLVGDFDEAATLADLKSKFGSWANPTPYTRIVSDFIPNPTKTESLETPDKANALLLSGINIKIDDKNPDYPALYIGNYLLGGGFLNSRLAVRIRQKEGISYNVGSQFSAPSLDETGQFTVYAIYAPENSKKLQEALLEEINKVRNEGFTEEELSKAKEGLLQGRQVSRSKDNELAGKLNGYLYTDRKMTFDADFDKKISGLTLDQINNTFRKYIDPSKLTTIQAGDFAKKFSEKSKEESQPAGKVSGAE